MLGSLLLQATSIDDTHKEDFHEQIRVTSRETEQQAALELIGTQLA